MEPVNTGGSDSNSWTEEELRLLKCLVSLNIPMDMICSELDRSWTSSALKAIDLGLNFCLNLPARNTARIKWVKEIQN
jgi:hypothetical protein